MIMLKRLAALAALALTLACFATPAFAGSPHFVGTPTATISGDTLTVSGKEAGLGNETQIHVVVTADAACINPGDQHPEAANKESFSAEGTFPVQNGRANFSLTVTATFQPSCSPPMTVVWSNIVVTDVTNGISVALP
jgi:hypothetical protein